MIAQIQELAAAVVILLRKLWFLSSADGSKGKRGQKTSLAAATEHSAPIVNVACAALEINRCSLKWFGG